MGAPLLLSHPFSGTTQTFETYSLEPPQAFVVMYLEVNLSS